MTVTVHGSRRGTCVAGFDERDRLPHRFRDHQVKGATDGTGLVERPLGRGRASRPVEDHRWEGASLPLNGGRWNGHAPRFGDTRCRILNSPVSLSLLPKRRTRPVNGYAG